MNSNKNFTERNTINLNCKTQIYSNTHIKLNKIRSHLIILIISLLCLSLLPTTNSELIEPLNIFLERKLFFEENLKNFTSNLEILTQNMSYYETAINLSLDPSSARKCIAKRFIRANEELLSFDLDNTISLFDDFPLKKLFINLLNQESLLPPSAKNLTNYLLLSLRLMFDLKANFKETYILLKKYDESEFQIMKNYSIKRPKFIHKYIQLLPLSDYYGQMSWSLEDIEEYKVSGILPVTKDKIGKKFIKSF